MKKPSAKHLLYSWGIQNAVKRAFRGLPPGAECCLSIDSDFSNSPTGPVFMPLLSVRKEHVRRIAALLSDLVGCAAYRHSRRPFINGACPRLAPFSQHYKVK